MKQSIKVFLREQRPKVLSAKYLFTTDWRESNSNEGSDYREVVFEDEGIEFRCYIDRTMKNYDAWETWLQLAEKGHWYTVRILYKPGMPVYRGNQIRLNGDGIPKLCKDIDPDPKDTLLDFGY